MMKLLSIFFSKENKINSINIRSDDWPENELSKDYLQRKFPEFFMVKLFQPGESFGEIALMTKERR